MFAITCNPSIWTFTHGMSAVRPSLRLFRLHLQEVDVSSFSTEYLFAIIAYKLKLQSL